MIDFARFPQAAPTVGRIDDGNGVSTCKNHSNAQRFESLGLAHFPSFAHPILHFMYSINNNRDSEATGLSIPVIDLEGLEFESPTKRKEIVAKLGQATGLGAFFKLLIMEHLLIFWRS
ncbi:unnamed protein product [Prunus armeniaca]